MTFDVNQIAAAAPIPDPGSTVLTRRGGDGFAAVYDLTAKRSQASGPPIPDELWDEVDAASRTAAEIERSGHALRFAHRLDGRIVAKLCDSDGAVVRPVSLSEVIDVGSQGPQEAA